MKESIETFTESSLEDFIELSKTQYGLSIVSNIEHTRWKHLASPLGASTNIRLVVNKKTIGRSMLQPKILLTQTGECNTACVTDVLIHPKFRSNPANFINLTKASENISKFDSVYHTSNEHTEPFYSKLFKYPQPFSLKGYGFPLRFSNLFFKFSNIRLKILDWLTSPFYWVVSLIASIVITASKINFSEQLPSDEMLNKLWFKSILKSGPIFIRNRAYLKWRLIDAPKWAAKVYTVESKGSFIGYVATRKFKLNGIIFLVVIDFLFNTDINIFERIVLRLWLLKQAIKLNVDALFSMINPESKVSRVCIGFPMLPIPDKFLPHATPVFFRAKDAENIDFKLFNSTHMTTADIDYF